MQLLAIGLSHKSAPLEIRERIALSPNQVTNFLRVLRASDPSYPIQECAVISTCNRFEAYMVISDATVAREAILDLLCQNQQVTKANLAEHIYILQGEEVVHHLMQVAAGLDSMVLGEAQILGQLVTTYQDALQHQSVSAILSRLLQNAIHAGKRVRTETAIGHNPASVSSVAVRLAVQHLGDLADQTVTVLGAGEMGALTVKALIHQGVRHIRVVSRSQERADKLADSWRATGVMGLNVTAHTFTNLTNVLADTTLVISSTGAVEPVVKPEHLTHAGNDRSMLLIDIGLPRDIDPQVGAFPGVHLYNLDDLEAKVARSLKERQQEIPQAQLILAEEGNAFCEWYHARYAVPTILHFREQFEAIKVQELDRTMNRLQHLNERDQELVNELAHRLLNKFLHQPTIHLKKEAARGNGVMARQALHDLFGLETELH